MLQYEARVFAAFLQAALEYAVLQQIEAGLDRIDPRSIKLRILVLPGVCCRTRDLNDARSTTRRTSQCELLEKEFLVFRNCLWRARDVFLIWLAFPHTNGPT